MPNLPLICIPLDKKNFSKTFMLIWQKFHVKCCVKYANISLSVETTPLKSRDPNLIITIQTKIDIKMLLTLTITLVFKDQELSF